MAKLIIYVDGNPMAQGPKRGDYLWSVEHKCYIWKGKILTEQELEPEFRKAALHFPKILRAMVKVVEFSRETPERIDDEISPVSTLTTAREITVAEAEDVMERLAPHRLKLKPGPKKALVIEETG